MVVQYYVPRILDPPQLSFVPDTEDFYSSADVVI